MSHSPRGFGISEELRVACVSEEHLHAEGQILFSSRGTLSLSTPGGEWRLPPQHAAWLPPGTPHVVMAQRGASLRTVYLSAQLLSPSAPRSTTLFVVSPLAREMFLYAMRWGPEHEADARADAFFAAVAALLPDWLQSRISLSLPVASGAELAQVMTRIQEGLAEGSPLSIALVARTSGLSGRTLQRRFMEETGVSFRQYLFNARILTAMELLGQPSAQVRQVDGRRWQRAAAECPPAGASSPSRRGRAREHAWRANWAAGRAGP